MNTSFINFICDNTKGCIQLEYTDMLSEKYVKFRFACWATSAPSFWKSMSRNQNIKISFDEYISSTSPYPVMGLLVITGDGEIEFSTNIEMVNSDAQIEFINMM